MKIRIKTVATTSTELSELQVAYRKFFKAKLKSYGVKSPAELSEEDKSKFFSEIKTEWSAVKGTFPEKAVARGATNRRT